MTDSKILDSSVWLDYFLNNEQAKLIESEEKIITSAISLFEIKRKLLRENYKKEQIKKIIHFIKQRGRISNINENLAEDAAEIALKKKLHMADAIIYATAQHHQAHLLTLDTDFKNLENVTVLDYSKPTDF